MEEKAKQIAELLKVLANENRLMILCALIQKPMTVNEIGKFVPGITQSALSQHLSLLRAHGILSGNKKGQTVLYCIIDKRIEAVIEVLKEHYCDKTVEK